MTSVFVYEHVTALGAGGGPEPPPAPSLLAEGRAMLEAVRADFQVLPGVRVRTVDANPDEEFDRLAAKSDYTLVIAPESGGTLEGLCRRVLAAGGRLLGPAPEGVRLAADKLELCRRLRAAGVPSPECRPLDEAPALGYPVVWKPRDGAGSQATFLVRDPSGETSARQALAAEEGHGPMIAQAYVEGTAASMAFVIGPATATPLVPCRQHLSQDGRFSYRGGSLPLRGLAAERALEAAAAAVRCLPGLAGYVGVDVVVSGREAWVIEVNPRLTTSYVGLRALAEFNLAGAMLAAVRGETLPVMRWKSGSVTFSPDGEAHWSPDEVERLA